MAISTINAKMASSVETFALYRTFERALEQCNDFKLGGPGIVGLVTPEGKAAEDYKACAVAFLYEGVERDDWDNVGYACISATDKPDHVKSEFAGKCWRRNRAIVITETRNLPLLVSVAVDKFIELDTIGEDDLRVACAYVLKLKMTAKQARQLLAFPPDLMFAAIRRNSTAADAIRRLNSVSPTSPAVKPIEESLPRLEELHGYGDAKEWGLQLAKDLAAWKAGILKWSEVDRGLLLSGPPGVGKTIFARALAETCEVNFVATSVVQWQAKGHLGDLLKAMRAEFASAVNKAPCILLLDELDSIGDRNTFTGEHASYSIQIVNALLEALDGSVKRDGLVVIGATNFPGKIDAAIRRPGRLDRHVVIGMPSSADRVAIIGQMLGEHELTDLHTLGPLTEAMAGADLAQMVRDAKKRARREDRRVTLSDLTSQLPELIQITGYYRHTVAIHEAGHTVVGNALGLGMFVGVTVVNQLNPRFELQSAGGARFEFPALHIRNEQRFRDEICLRLAGIAAERLILGSHGDGCGLGPTSDLAIATDLALQMETKTGMGARLYQFGKGTAWDAFGAQSVPWLMDRVDEILRREMARAGDIVAAQRSLLLAVTKELEDTGFVLPDRFDHLRKEFEKGPSVAPIKRVRDPGRRASGTSQGDSRSRSSKEAQR
ncbi:ATP-dependent Zn protease [Rhizobium leguminosarum bv. trifolii WSM2297]|uniref:ATP-dependent Zn protease n=1 Tax=Rhizobium leguminosarum bv. trifolii WSM2297 TaxID=754762 RepID=J0CBY5_RHILT|nr:AAA family ATPase [Rhizobium leguminosarum]EJC80662.1 ATP-dependent Zn protease [Rhizobium leguminosarum bv. trifolii WSM2297]